MFSATLLDSPFFSMDQSDKTTSLADRCWRSRSIRSKSLVLLLRVNLQPNWNGAAVWNLHFWGHYLSDHSRWDEWAIEKSCKVAEAFVGEQRLNWVLQTNLNESRRGRLDCHCWDGPSFGEHFSLHVKRKKELTTEDHVVFGIQVLFTSTASFNRPSPYHTIDLLHLFSIHGGNKWWSDRSSSSSSYSGGETIWSTLRVITIIKHLWVTSKNDGPRIRRRSAMRFKQIPLYGGTTPPLSLLMFFITSLVVIINSACFGLLS